MQRVLGSAAVAGFLMAGNIVALTLFLAPNARLLREGQALFVSLFLPYGVAASLAFAALGVLLAFLGPRYARPPVPGLPYLTFLALVQAAIGAGLFWWNLVSYRHSIPVPFVSALFAASVAVSLAALVLLGAGLDALFFPDRGRSALVGGRLGLGDPWREGPGGGPAGTSGQHEREEQPDRRDDGP